MGRGHAAGARHGGSLQWQHIAHHRVQALHEYAAQAFTLHHIVQPGVERVHVDRQAALTPQVVPRVFKAWGDVVRRQAEFVCQGGDKTLRIGTGVGAGLSFVGEQGGVLPDWLAILAPENTQRPTRQLLTWVPLALAKVQEAAFAVLGAQLLHQLCGVTAFGGAQRIDVPLGRVSVGGGHERGLAAHGQAHVTGGQVLVHQLAEGQHAGPLLIGVGGCNARRFVNSGHAHVVGKLDLGLVNAAFNRRGAGRLGGAGQWDVTFARH